MKPRDYMMVCGLHLFKIDQSSFSDKMLDAGNNKKSVTIEFDLCTNRPTFQEIKNNSERFFVDFAKPFLDYTCFILKAT